MPPIPEPIHTPTRFAFSVVISNLASLTAIFDAAISIMGKPVHFSASFRSIISVILKSFTSPAVLAGYSSALNLVNGPIPFLPLITVPKFSQCSRIVLPNGDRPRSHTHLCHLYYTFILYYNLFLN